MLKKKKTTASGKLVLVKSVRRHWTSGGCPFSADRSGTETAQPQNEILCSKGLGGRYPQQASGEENHGGIFFSAGLCVLTQALLAPFFAEMQGASEETVKFHSPAQFVSNFSDNSVSSFAVSCVWCKRVSRISDGQLQ